MELLLCFFILQCLMQLFLHNMLISTLFSVLKCKWLRHSDDKIMVLVFMQCPEFGILSIFLHVMLKFLLFFFLLQFYFLLFLLYNFWFNLINHIFSKINLLFILLKLQFILMLINQFPNKLLMLLFFSFLSPFFLELGITVIRMLLFEKLPHLILVMCLSFLL